MSQEKKIKKPFKEWGVVKFLKEQAPELAGDLIRLAGKGTGVSLLTELGDRISSSKELSKERKQEALLMLHEEAKMYLEDIKDARDMYKNSDHEMADKIANRVITWNLWVVLISVCIEILAVIYINDKVLIAIISGAIGSITTALLQERQQIINFFFGSSKGSKDKDLKK